MSKADTWEDGILALAFTNVDFTGLGDAGGILGSVTPGSLYISLHTADPAEGGDQTTNEIAYTNYSRKDVARSGAGWTVLTGTVDNDAAITFPAGTGGSGTATHFGVGTASAGAGKLMYSGLLTPNVVCGDGVTPEIPAGSLDVSEE